MLTRRPRTMLLLALLSFVAAACGGGATAVPETSSTDSPDTTAIASTDAPTSSQPTEAAAVAGALDTAELGAPYLGALTFDWPEDCKVPVVETVLRQGQNAELEWNLALEGDAKDLLISFDDVVVNTLDGSPVPDDVAAQAVASVALPSLRVGADGTVRDIIGMDTLVDQIEAAAGGDFEMTPAAVALLEEGVVDKYWGSWAGIWASWGSFDEADEVGASEQPIGDEVVVSDIEMSSLGTAGGSLVALRSTITLDGDDFALALGGAMDTLGNTDSTGSSPTIDGQRVTVIETVTDSATLRPASAFVSIATELTMNGETRTNLEERRWTFDWTACT